MPTPFDQETGTRQQPIPLCAPEIRGREWEYVKECLETGWVSSVGSFVDRFERECAAYLGSRRAVATASGTAALHVALLVAGVEAGDEVLVPALTFIAPANAVRYVGAWPVFMDAEPRYGQMDPAKIADFLTRECVWQDGKLRNRATGRPIKALLPVHILGHPVDMAPLLELARKYDLRVIEDATESLGARFQGRMVGTLGDVACFSFNGNKLLTTGCGGIIVTDNDNWANRSKYLTTQAKDDPVEYVHYSIGYNYRLTNIQAALGCAQLEQVEEFLAVKRRIAAGYASALGGVPGMRLLAEAPWARSACWLSTILVDERLYGMDSRQLLRRLGERGIQARPLWQPMHMSPAHADCQSYCVDVADRLHQQALSLPSSVGLTAAQQRAVTDCCRELAVPE
jgi:perosamine synthetase